MGVRRSRQWFPSVVTLGSFTDCMATADADYAHYHTPAPVLCADDIRRWRTDGMGRHRDDLDVLLRHLGGVVPAI